MSTFTDEIAALALQAEAAAFERGRAEGYQRGKADAKQEILQMLTTNLTPEKVDSAMGTIVSEGRAAPNRHTVRRTSVDRVRAPRGIVPALITRVLADERGYLPREILEKAVTEHEKMVKPASVRSELNAGKDIGKYISIDGKWFLSGETGSHSSRTDPPLLNTEKGDSHEAAPIVSNALG